MEISRMVRGENIDFAASRTAKKAEAKTAGTARPSTDRVELSRQWVQSMEEQRAVQTALLTTGKTEDKEEGGLLAYMETEEEKLDALSEEMDVQMKCLKIAMNIMKGKKVPPQDEKYLMEHDPNGYKLAMAMKTMVKEDKKECKSVLDDEDKKDGEASETGESAPAEAPSSDGGAAVE